MFGIVILNYVNFFETVEAIKNIHAQVWSPQTRIYVVENGSGNVSESKLREIQQDYSFELIVSDANLGFACGVNLGIAKARRDGCEYVIELNSDARFGDGQPNFIDKLKDIFNQSPNIALITPNIINLDDVPQNPMNRSQFSFVIKCFLKCFFYLNIDKLYFYLRTGPLYHLVNVYVSWRDRRRNQRKRLTVPESGFIYAALGSCQVLTPTFFDHFDGHDERTFLYCEEYIMAEHLLKKGLTTWYESSLLVVHGESKSVEMVTGCHREKVRFLLYHMFKSGRIYAKLLSFSWRK